MECSDEIFDGSTCPENGLAVEDLETLGKKRLARIEIAKKEKGGIGVPAPGAFMECVEDFKVLGSVFLTARSGARGEEGVLGEIEVHL